MKISELFQLKADVDFLESFFVPLVADPDTELNEWDIERAFSIVKEQKKKVEQLLERDIDVPDK